MYEENKLLVRYIFLTDYGNERLSNVFHQMIHVHELWWLAKVQQHAWCVLRANDHICKGRTVH